MVTITQDDKLTYDIDECAALLGISKATAYNGVQTGHIPSVRVGRRILVPKAQLHALIAGEPNKRAA